MSDNEPHTVQDTYIQQVRDEAAAEERLRWAAVLDEQAAEERRLSEDHARSRHKEWKTLGVLRRGHANACTQIAKALRANDPDTLK